MQMLLTGPKGDLDTSHAACSGVAYRPDHDPERDRFFPVRGTAQITARDAKSMCNGENGRPECPILEQCLEYALERKERFGIWGGKSERERARIAKERRVAAKRRELEAQQAAVARSERVRRGWETRRRRALEQQEQAALAATRSKGRRGKSSSTGRDSTAA